MRGAGLSTMAELPDKQPWYVGAAYKLGIPAIISLVFIWAWYTRIEPFQQDLNDKLTAHVISTGKITDQNQKVIDVLERINTVMIRNCVNAAKTDAARDSCFR